MPGQGLSPRQHAVLYQAVQDGAHQAAKGLQGMTGQPISAATLSVALVPLGDVVGAVGRADAPTTAVYLGIYDGLNGHLVLLLTDEAAARLADLLLEQQEGTTGELGEIEQSALQEAGNITGSFFLTSLADATGLTIQPTPPVLLRDMCGAILDGPLAALAMESDEALLIETEFRQAERHIQGLLLVLPDHSSLATLLGRLA